MKSQYIRMGLLFVIAALLVVGCSGPSRVASTPVQVPGQDTGQQPADPGDQAPPAVTDAPSQVETMMAAGDLMATMTAAAVDTGQQSASDATPEPGATEVPAETQAPQAENPTAVPPTNTPKPPEPTPKPKVDCSSPYTVKKGDWVWDIGRRCNIDPNSIIAVNGLAYPFIIFPGDILILPANAPPFTGP